MKKKNRPPAPRSLRSRKIQAHVTEETEAALLALANQAKAPSLSFYAATILEQHVERVGRIRRAS